MAPSRAPASSPSACACTRGCRTTILLLLLCTAATAADTSAVATSGTGRALLQGDAPNASLPNIFNLPVCSKYGSHNTDWLRSVTRFRPGIVNFGPQDIELREFHPLSSAYMEPILVIAFPGMVAWLISLISGCCFCYRRYHLGRCGEPFPTVKAYTPRQVLVTLIVATFSFVILFVASAAAVLVATASFQAGFDSFSVAGFAAESLMSSAFAAGRQLLEAALSITTELDQFGSLVGADLDPESFEATLACAEEMLLALPDGAHMLAAIEVLGAAVATVPAATVTDCLFADLERPHQSYPLQVPRKHACRLRAIICALHLRLHFDLGLDVCAGAPSAGEPPKRAAARCCAAATQHFGVAAGGPQSLSTQHERPTDVRPPYAWLRFRVATARSSRHMRAAAARSVALVHSLLAHSLMGVRASPPAGFATDPHPHPHPHPHPRQAHCPDPDPTSAPTSRQAHCHPVGRCQLEPGKPS